MFNYFFRRRLLKKFYATPKSLKEFERYSLLFVPYIFLSLIWFDEIFNKNLFKLPFETGDWVKVFAIYIVSFTIMNFIARKIENWISNITIRKLSKRFFTNLSYETKAGKKIRKIRIQMFRRFLESQNSPK